jgi:hypothetical protein
MNSSSNRTFSTFLIILLSKVPWSRHFNIWYFIIGITRSPLKSHQFSDPGNSVSMKTLFKLFINHGNPDHSFVEVIIHICMVFGYDLLCDLCMNRHDSMINKLFKLSFRRNTVRTVRIDVTINNGDLVILILPTSISALGM